jgi:hypothetical protein
MITGRQLVNEYYEDEKLYSTGDDYLDELLEKAFCEGYEYAQKEFARAIPTNKVVAELKKRGKDHFTLDSVGQIEKVVRDKKGNLRLDKWGKPIKETASYDRWAVDKAVSGWNKPETVHDNINLRQEVKDRVKNGTASFGDMVATKGGKLYSPLRMNTEGFMKEIGLRK